MDKHTFGDSKAAINLVTTLETPEYQVYQRLSCKRLSKQTEALKALMFIPDKNTRETALELWDKNFTLQVNTMEAPEVIKSHILCVAAGHFRESLAISRRKIQTKERFRLKRKVQRRSPVNELPPKPITLPTMSKIYEKAITNCPNGCGDPPFAAKAVPIPYSITNLKNASCFCFKCQTYWEVNSYGMVVNTKWGINSKKYPENTLELLKYVEGLFEANKEKK